MKQRTGGQMVVLKNWPRWVFSMLVVTLCLKVSAEPFQTQHFELALSDVTIVGTLEQPLTTQPVAIALLVAGSGPTDRDGNTPLIAGKNDSLKLLAQELASHGIATLRFDKRGVGESRMAVMDESKLRFDTFVNDVVAILAELERKGFQRRYLIGHSEGALISSLAAKQRQVQAVVLLCGAGRPIDVILKEQLARSAPQLLPGAEKVIHELKQGKLVANVPPILNSLFRPSVQPYMQSWLRHDPAVVAGALGVSVFSISGSTDIQVSEADAQALALQKNISSLRIENMNHVLKTVASIDPIVQQNAYTNPALPLASELVPSLVAFIQSGKTHE